MTGWTKLATAGAAALALAVIPSQAQAIVLTCTASSAGVAFGTVSGATVQVTGMIRLNCTGLGRTNPVNVALSTGSSGAYNPRRMQSGTRTMTYNLYTNVARTDIFGNGTGGTSTVSENIDFVLVGSTAIDVPVYGRVPAQGLLAPGSYTDTIIVTVTY